MKITRIEVIQIETPRYYQLETPDKPFSGHVMLKVHVDDGPIGLGEASDSRADDVGAIARQYRELLVGRDATCITEINQLLQEHRFNSTVTDVHLTSAVDIALYDLNAKAAGVPAHRLMGGKLRDKIYCCYPIFGWQVKEDFDKERNFDLTIQARF